MEPDWLKNLIANRFKQFCIALLHKCLNFTTELGNHRGGKNAFIGEARIFFLLCALCDLGGNKFTVKTLYHKMNYATTQFRTQRQKFVAD